MSDDEDFEVSQWRNGQWNQCGSSQQCRRGQSSLRQSQLNSRPSQQSSQRSQSSQMQSSQQSQPVASTNISNNAAQDLLMTLIQSAVAAKLPVKEKKPKLPERERIQCLLCASTLATQTTLFRHYKMQHNITNPARFLGYKESNVFNLDSTMEEFQCTDCGFVVPNSHALDIHVKAAHKGESNNNNSKEKCNECGFEANNRHELDVHSRVHASSSDVNSTLNNTTVNSTINNPPNNTTVNGSGGNVNQNANKTKDILNSLHRCDKCVCYFEEKRKLDEHMKDVHGAEVVCNICNKYLAYEHYEDHFKSTHPEVFNTKNKVQRREKTVIRKFFRNMSGKIVAVYKCVKCNDTFTDEINAKRHFKLHGKVKTAETVDNNAENEDVNDNNETLAVKDTLYICGACKTSTASYDMAVEHSQSHITNPNIQFVTKTCEICNFKFGICYEQHVTRHCVEENLRKESFTCYEFDYNLLLSNDWSNFLPEEERQRIISKSIYEHTRSVKMRVLSGENSTSLLFRCGKCKRFVSPASVANHTRNYDTCLRISEEFPCSICKRVFNDRNTLDDHKQLHADEKSFKVVVFNTEVDKSFNDLLNVAHSTTQESSTPQEPSNAADNTLYKCLCSLCFISKETADEHLKVCPGKEPKQYCQKCNYLFSHSEIMPHHLKHHTTNGNTTFVVENICPDAVEVESDHEPEKDDDEIKVITLSDDDEEQIPNVAENQPHLAASMEASRNNEVDCQGSSILNQATNIVSGIDSNTDQFSRAAIKNEDQNDETQLPDCDNDDAMSVGSYDIIENTDSQDTDINGEDASNTESEAQNLYNNVIKTEIKCVPTGALMNPLYYENRANKQYNIIHETESETQDDFGVSGIKEERDIESPYIRISGRPTLRSVTNLNEIPTYDLLTDDEDTPDDVPVENSATADNNYSIDTFDTTVVNVIPANEGFDNIDQNVATDQTTELTDNQQQINTAPASDSTIDINVHDVSAESFPEITDFVEIDDNLVLTPLGTFNTVDEKKNTALKKRSNDPVVNRELAELNKIKRKLIALNQNGAVNRYNEDVIQSLTEPVFQELSLEAFFEKTYVSDQNVRIDIEYNSVTNDLTEEMSCNDAYAPIRKRNTYIAGNAIDFKERLRLTGSNMALDVQQKHSPKRAIPTVAGTSSEIHKPDDYFTMNIAQNDQNIISSPVVRRRKISMRMKRDLKMKQNDNNCSLS